ncbi:MAG: hypothetical protein P8Y28_03590 [Gammaproteobacteria bacterium]
MFKDFPFLLKIAQEDINRPFGIDMSIEGMSTQNFSTGMFYFLIFAIVVFLVIAFMFMFKDKTQKLKKGEKILFIWILIGVIVAVAFGAAQMMHGFLV